MLSELQAVFADSAAGLWRASQMLALSAVYFGLLALLVKGLGAIEAARRSRHETAVNLWLFVLDVLLFAPIVTIVIQIIRGGLVGSPLELVRPAWWDSLPIVVTGFTRSAVSLGRYHSSGSTALFTASSISPATSAVFRSIDEPSGSSK